jgi:hypothetical protein
MAEVRALHAVAHKGNGSASGGAGPSPYPYELRQGDGRRALWTQVRPAPSGSGTWPQEQHVPRLPSRLRVWWRAVVDVLREVGA